MPDTKTLTVDVPDGENANKFLASWLTDNSDTVIVRITRSSDGWDIEYET